MSCSIIFNIPKALPHLCNSKCKIPSFSTISNQIQHTKPDKLNKVYPSLKLVSLHFLSSSFFWFCLKTCASLLASYKYSYFPNNFSIISSYWNLQALSQVLTGSNALNKFSTKISCFVIPVTALLGTVRFC